MEELAPLAGLCKAGRLFEVQEWIASGKPINIPSPLKKGRRLKSPLLVSIEHGFHSLVQVLLESGAIQEPEGYDSPMNHALRSRRFDLVQLLVKHGFDPKSVDLMEVFNSWDPQVMSFFLEKGADLLTGNPFSVAFCSRIRTALRPFKEYRDRFPELQEQANIALRHHCKEGNLKWVSLMLWARADPHKQGTDDPHAVLDDDDAGASALTYAALYQHYDVFELKPIRSVETKPEMRKVLRYLIKQPGLVVLHRLLKKGVNPNDEENGGCSAYQATLWHMTWARSYSTYSWDREKKIDSYEARELMKAIHLLAKFGAKWLPDGSRDISSTRKHLFCLDPAFTLEFIWIMSKYQACSKECVEQLLRTPKMKSHLSQHREQLTKLLASWNVQANATIDHGEPG